MPTLLLDDVMELERHEQVMPEMLSSLNPNTWMDSAELLLSFFLVSSLVLMFAGQQKPTLIYFLTLFCFVVHSLHSCRLRVFFLF